MATTAPVIDVIDPSGRKLALPAWAMGIITSVVVYALRHAEGGRVAGIIGYALTNQERIDTSWGGHFAVHYGSGKKLKPEILDQIEGD